jgi:hypothetical protein
MFSLAIGAAAVFAAGVAADLDPQDAQCRVIHYAADGARHETAPTQRYAGPPRASASVSSSGPGSASSSVSASSSTSSRNGAASVVVRTQHDGRAITKTYDNEGCTVVVDDRPGPGASR